MNKYAADAIRNIALVGHGGTGKTSLVETALFITGAKDRIGKVEEGTTTADFDPAEIKRHMSISAALAPVEFGGCKINLIDAPGYPDFIAEVHGALRVADAAVLFLSAGTTVEVGTESAWDIAAEHNLPRVFFVNRLDRENADFLQTVEALRKKFGPRVVPIQLPIGSEASLSGIVDLVNRQTVTWDGTKSQASPIPAELEALAAQWRDTLVECAAEGDDDLMTKYLEGEELSSEEVVKGLREGVASGTVYPVLCGSVAKNLGVQGLLDWIVKGLPSAADTPLAKAVEPQSGKEVTLQLKEDAPLAALVFKTTADPYVGKLTYFRVYSGQVKSDTHAWNANKEHEERIGPVYVLHGKKQEAVPTIGPGDLGAVAKLTHTSTGDTLCDKVHPYRLAPIDFPEPVYSVAVAAKSKADEDKLGPALARLADQDPTFHFRREPETGQTVVSTMGDTHVDVMVEALKRIGADVEVGEVRIPYRETIKGRSEAQGRHKKQTGGRGQFGDCWIKLEPLPQGSGLEYVDAIVGGSIPRQFIPAVEKGVQEAMQRGVLAGYPTVDVKVTCYDGSYHNVDSSEQAFKMAGILAFHNAVEKASPTLLEPIVNAEIVVPEEYMGDVISDLNTKRGRVQGMEPVGNGKQLVKAQVPQSEMLRYAIDLRSISRGRGRFSTEYSHYEEVPAHVAQQIVEQSKKEKSE
ncbi:MAG TPA: elongation factor G [Armatimonadota bacterium]